MKLQAKQVFIMELTPQEFRIIKNALEGEIKQEFKEDAIRLAQEMFNTRNQQVQSQLENILKHSAKE